MFGFFISLNGLFSSAAAPFSATGQALGNVIASQAQRQAMVAALEVQRRAQRASVVLVKSAIPKVSRNAT